jgi:alkanesulfonate monooxygenase SsuD/methylene tetrahydromethanopterin reductase-like flavin-dependent oxidoreductase (luciferase family)
MKLGLLVEVEEGLTWPRWRAIVSRVEELGFESVWISDHLSSPWSRDTPRLETWTALAVAAAETRRVRLGPLVSPVTFRAPAMHARMAEALQQLSCGRFTLGLGLGWNASEHEQFGLAFPSVLQRARLIEQTAGYVHGVPLLIGGKGEQFTLPLVARFADEWNMTTGSAAVVRERSSVLEEQCLAIGRDPRAIARSVAVGYLVGSTAGELRERGARLQRWVKPLADVDLDDVPTAARDLSWLVGTPDEIAEQLDDLESAGVERVIFGHYDLDDLSSLESVAKMA